jgi:hypothetical protein
MESKVQNKEQQLSIYWEKNVGGVKRRILTQRRTMKDVKYRNHR